MSKLRLPIVEAMALASRKVREGKSDEAKALYHQVLAERPGHKKAKKALKALQRDSKNSLDVADFHRVTQLMNQGMADAALREVRILCKHHPKEPALHNLRGVVLDEAGEPADAVEAFRRAFTLEPAYSEALSNYASSLTKLERYKEALAAFQELVNRGHADAASHRILAKALKGEGQIDNAIKALQRAIQLQPAYPAAFVDLGKLFTEQGERDKAIDAYENALAIDSKNYLALSHLATAYSESQQYPLAIGTYQKMLEHYPNNASALLGLGSAKLFSGDRATAISLFERALALEPENAVTSHLLAAASGDTPIDGSSEYARAVFDSYARGFEQTLTGALGYSFPDRLPDLLETLDGADAWYSHALDLGCGTGLVGPQIRSYCEHLVGVDVSANMLERAEEKAVYDELDCQDALEFLATNPTPWNLVIGADILVHFGNLDALFAALDERCEQGANVVLTTESLEGNGYELRPSGRFAHSADYLIQSASTAGLSLVQQESISLRKEGQDWIPGDVFVLTKH